MYEVKIKSTRVDLVEDGLVAVSAPDLDTLAERVAALVDEARGVVTMRERQAQEARDHLQGIAGALGTVRTLATLAEVGHGQG